MEYSYKLRKDIIAFVEFLFEKAKNIYEDLEKAKKEYKKLKYNLDNPYKSKKDFVIKIMSLDENELEEYKRLLNEQLDDKQIQDLLKAVKNYYFIIENSLDDREESKEQKETAINTLDENYEVSSDALATIEKKKLEEKIDSLTSEFNNIDSIGKCFNYGYQTGLKDADIDMIVKQRGIQIGVIDNFRYLEKIIEEFDYPDFEKSDIVLTIMSNNIEIYEKRAKQLERKIKEFEKWQNEKLDNLEADFNKIREELNEQIGNSYLPTTAEPEEETNKKR